MSDIIPPLISSTPPPMPEFDDEEDDDDDFGMGSGIGDLGLDFQDAAQENNDKALTIDSLRSGGERSNGNHDAWPSNEEQDSASQDSGLCMASHDSEGVSPLPQSDDEERDNGELRHSATVVFDSGSESKVIPADTGQKPLILPETETDVPSKGGEDEVDDEDRSDDEFGNWTVAENSQDFQCNNFPTNQIEAINSIQNTNLHLCNGIKDSVENCTIKDSSTESPSIVNRTISENNVQSNENELDTDSSVVSGADKCVNSLINSKLESFSDVNSRCADSTFSEHIPIECVTRSNENCEDVSDSHDFGNFESVTVESHLPYPICPDSVNSDSIQNVENIVSANTVDDDSFGDFTFTEFSEPVNVEPKNVLESKSTKDQNCESGSSVAGTIEERPLSLEIDVTSDNKYTSLNHPLCQRSCDSSAAVCEDINAAAAANDDDDDDDDFSDFTQSQTVETEVDQVKVQESLSHGSQNISSQDGFEDIFPKEDQETDDAKTDDLKKGAIWQHLCSLENSPALSFQWPNSIAHTKLLSALNIDSRNILFGPRWNTNIPRFAANLGLNPLQPVKASERSSASPAANIHPSDVLVQKEETVPDAHFDWVGSGLTNPLDCVSRTSLQTADELGDKDGCKRISKLDNLKVLSSEAEKIVSQLPDMNVMKKTYIEVLISKV